LRGELAGAAAASRPPLVPELVPGKLVEGTGVVVVPEYGGVLDPGATEDGTPFAAGNKFAWLEVDEYAVEVLAFEEAGWVGAAAEEPRDGMLD
jgi:hypothetical protein